MQAECRYTKMIANLLDGIEIRLNTDYLAHKVELDAIAEKVVYTGPIDAYFGYKLGTLEYRSVRFETETLDEGRNRANGTHPRRICGLWACANPPGALRTGGKSMIEFPGERWYIEGDISGPRRG